MITRFSLLNFLAVVALLALGGCATGPAQTDTAPIPEVLPEPEPEAPSPEPVQEKPDTPPVIRPEPSPSPQRPCAWSQTRGIATLLAVRPESTSSSNEAQEPWQFVPGDKVVFHKRPETAGVGDEFKAMLKEPLSGPCRHAQLILFSPLQPEPAEDAQPASTD